ncbi:MAG: FAD:protein FMN transferase [Patescibacteria group bacterium]
MYRNEFDAIGTHWCIDLPATLDAQRVEFVMGKIRNRIEIFDKAYSRFRADSIVTAMSKKAGRYELPTDAVSMLVLYRKLYDLTGGFVTPLIGQALSDAGYDAAYSLKTKPMMAPKRWDDVMRVEGSVIDLLEPALLDFGAAGKGYLIDIVSDLIASEGIGSYCVDAGGDMRYRSDANAVLRVGLESPVSASQVIGVASVVNTSICGSAGNRRAWGAFNHILDPRSLSSPKHILAVWVVADSTLVADGLTTALMFVHPEALQPDFDFEYAIVYADLSLTHSKEFPGEFFQS